MFIIFNVQYKILTIQIYIKHIRFYFLTFSKTVLSKSFIFSTFLINDLYNFRWKTQVQIMLLQITIKMMLES